MLDQDIKSQLTEVFSVLESSIDLIYDLSDNENQKELVGMLEDIASTSSKISARPSETKSVSPSFKIFKSNQFTGISFVGIPGGH